MNADFVCVCVCIPVDETEDHVNVSCSQRYIHTHVSTYGVSQCDGWVVVGGVAISADLSFP